MREHQRDIVTQKRVSKVDNHVSDTGHGFDFDNVKDLDNYSEESPPPPRKYTHSSATTINHSFR